jgi:peptide/nickel transport system ATP-binding protein
MSDSGLITVENLVVRFPIRVRGTRKFVQPVDRVTFQLRQGEVLALVGESGSGKTTIGKALVRILEPSSGRIVVNGTDVTHIHGQALKQHHKTVQMIFQDPFGSLNPIKTVEQHLQFPIRKHTGLKGAMLSQRIEELMEQVGLTPVQSTCLKYPHELSGGQRQRLAIARALAVQPKVVVADEPISMLDVSIRAGILKLMNKLRRDIGLSFLYITHDLASARYIGDRIMVLYGGKVMEIAESAELIRKPLHPYTQLLLAATPGRANLGPLPETSNEPPNLLVGRTGCPFAARCPLAKKDCATIEPEMREISTNHWVVCHCV